MLGTEQRGTFNANGNEKHTYNYIQNIIVDMFFFYMLKQQILANLTLI